MSKVRRRFLFALRFVILLSTGAAMGFTPPDEDQRRRAIGHTGEVPDFLRAALEPGDDFEPIPAPGVHDWLANHPEPGQTFEVFVHSDRSKPDGIRNRIYLQPLEAFPRGESPSLDQLQQFAEAFFAMKVKVLPVIEFADGAIETRMNPYSGHQQLLTRDILALLTRQLPDNAYGLLGITMRDLYPDPSWNFVFGQASYRYPVGVYSFARYDPRFYRKEARYDDKLVLCRSCKVLAHEICHMFGIQHCVFFHCLMNGSNHLRESDARPLHLCPMDLRKLHESIGFDILDRYRRLSAFWTEVGFDEEVEWLRVRLEHIEDRASGSPDSSGGSESRR